MTDDHRPPITPAHFGPYRLEALIGRGAVGEVYRAVDTRIDRPVALKILAPGFADDEEFKARFRRESEIVGRLTNGHIVPVHGFDEIDGRLYLDMRLIDGRDLGVLLREDGALAPARAADIIGQVASALAAAHGKGLIHRDVKPANVLLVPSEVGDGDFAYLADFGVARTVGGTNTTTITGKGATVGTLEYMAPERFSGDDIDHRVDIYALGCLLFECLTGAKPFRETAVAPMMRAHIDGPIPKPSATAHVPKAFDAVVAKALAKNPAERFTTVGALASACREAATAAAEAAPTGAGEATRNVQDIGPWRLDPTPPPNHPVATPTPTTRWDQQPPTWDRGQQQQATWSGYQQQQQQPPPPTTWERGYQQPPPTWERGYPLQPPPERRKKTVPILLSVAGVLVVGLVVTLLVVLLRPVASAQAAGSVTSIGSSVPPTSTPYTPPTPAVVVPPTNYTVAQMFSYPENGKCGGVSTEIPAVEADLMRCDRPDGSYLLFSRYTAAPSTYVATLQPLFETFGQLRQDDCGTTYGATFTTDGVAYNAEVVVYTKRAYVVQLTAEQSKTSMSQLLQQQWTVQDEADLCDG